MVPRLPGSRTPSRPTQRASPATIAGAGRGAQACSNTPSMTWGFSLPASLLRTACDTSRHSAPASSAQPTSSRATPPAALPARNARTRGFQPASRAVTSSEAPSATNRPVSRRALRMCSDRIILTRSFCRLVMARAARAASGRGGIAHPACEERRGKEPAARLLDYGELAALGGARARREAIPHQAVHGKGGCTDGVGGEHQCRTLRRKQGRAIAQSRRQVREHVPFLAVGATPELGRVDQDQMVAAAAAYLARHELARIVDNPADRLRI